MPCSPKGSSQNGERRHVILICGGMSAEREISLTSAKAVTQALIEIGHTVTRVDMDPNIGPVLAQLQSQLSNVVVFNCLHGTYGEDGCLPGLLNIMGIPYTHCGLPSSALAFNKQLAHNLFISNDIPTPKTIFISKSHFEWPKNGSEESEPLPRPYIIKPCSQGSSIGIHLVFPEDSFLLSDYEFKYGETILVQEFIKGREVDVAILNGVSLGIIEVKLINGKRFYDYETKYTPGFVEHVIPADIPKTKLTEILAMAEKVYRVFECRGLCRLEFILGEDLEIFFLEINTHPGMTPTSLSQKIAQQAGISFNELVERMLMSAQCDSI